jgi:hypothetical protein
VLREDPEDARLSMPSRRCSVFDLQEMAYTISLKARLGVAPARTRLRIGPILSPVTLVRRHDQAPPPHANHASLAISRQALAASTILRTSGQPAASRVSP